VKTIATSKVIEILYAIWENVDVIVAVPICVIVTLLSLLKEIPNVHTTSVILIVLAFLFYGTFKTRKTLQVLEYGKGAGVFFKDRNVFQPLKLKIAPACDMWFCGISLINVIPQLKEDFQRKLKKEGAKIRFLLIDPEWSALKSVADCTLETEKGIRLDIEVSIERIEHIAKKGIGNGEIELRLLKVAPGYSMVLIDPEKPYGRIIVEFIGYGSPILERPHIELTRQKDSPWYEYFLRQYNKLWNAHEQNCRVKKP
jgi:hypothetical protein